MYPIFCAVARMNALWRPHRFSFSLTLRLRSPLFARVPSMVK